MKKNNEQSSLNEQTGRIEGRNPITEAYRAGKTVEKLFVLDGCTDGPVLSILREAKKHGTIINGVSKDRLDAMSLTGAHQGVIAQISDYQYFEISDILENARETGEDPFIIILDEIVDPYNFGAIIRTANIAGAHGIITTKRRSAPLSASAVKASAGAANYVPIVKVTNLSAAIETLKKEGLWIVCADMDGESMYDLNLTGPIGLVLGSEGNGVGRLVKEKCDFTASIPMRGEIGSLNVSVAAGVLSYEIVRQRSFKI